MAWASAPREYRDRSRARQAGASCRARRHLVRLRSLAVSHETVVRLYYLSREEAEEAASALGQESLHGQVAETPLGDAWSVTVTGPRRPGPRGPRVHEPLVRGGPVRQREPTLDEVLPAVHEHLAGVAEVFAPAGIGGHSAHCLLRDAGLTAARDGLAVSFYADAHTQRSSAGPPGCAASNRNPFSLSTPPGGRTSS